MLYLIIYELWMSSRGFGNVAKLEPAKFGSIYFRKKIPRWLTVSKFASTASRRFFFARSVRFLCRDPRQPRQIKLKYSYCKNILLRQAQQQIFAFIFFKSNMLTSWDAGSLPASKTEFFAKAFMEAVIY